MLRSLSTLFVLLVTTFYVLAQPSLDQEAILEGVGTVQVPEDILPGAVCFFGENAFPILLGQPDGEDDSGQPSAMIPMAAATCYGKGRTVIFGHDQLISSNFFNANANDTTLCINLIAWLAGGNKPLDQIRVAVIDARVTFDILKTKKVKADSFPVFTTEAVSDQFDILIMNAERIRDEQVASIDQFVKNGGGLMASATGWGWQQLNPAGNLKTTFAGNRLVAPMGLVWAEQTLPQTHGYTPALCGSKFLHPKVVLDALIEGLEFSPDDCAQAVATLGLALGSLPEAYSANLSALPELITRQVIPTKQKPVDAAGQPLDRLAMLVQTQRYMNVQERGGLPEGLEIPKLAAAVDFPGGVPKDAPRVSRTVEINPKIPDWHSTGLYAAPGDVITITIPAEVASRRSKLSVRIGALTDKLWHLPSWERYPEISLLVQLDKPVTQVVNPFGGHVYVVVPRNAPVKAVSVEIAGAVEAPYYVFGKTTDEQWKQSRQAPGPWAEFASDRVIITVPSYLVRELDDPKEVMEFWNGVLDACAELVGLVQRIRPERITADRQIAAGFMHSGYPIMIPTVAERGLTDLAYLKERGSKWGCFHEFGHNHQSGDWTFSGSGEVTVNLFTLYCYNKMYNFPIGETRREMQPEERKAAKARHIAVGAPFAQWRSDPFLALTMYVELIEEFGWDVFKTVFVEYRDLPANERPRNDSEKRDQWMTRFSKTVGKNLGPFFDQWGVPVSQVAKDSIADLPVWLPE